MWQRKDIIKQVQPQKFTQTYTQEENLFPESFRRELDKGKSDIELVLQRNKRKEPKWDFQTLLRKKYYQRNQSMNIDRWDQEMQFWNQIGKSLNKFFNLQQEVNLKG